MGLLFCIAIYCTLGLGIKTLLKILYYQDMLLIGVQKFDNSGLAVRDFASQFLRSYVSLEYLYLISLVITILIGKSAFVLPLLKGDA